MRSSPAVATVGFRSTLPPAMQLLDWLVVLGYFGVLFGLAWWVIKRKGYADDY